MQYSYHEFGILEFSAAGTLLPAPSPSREVEGLVGGGEEERARMGRGEEGRVGEWWGSCPEKHTPSSGCLHLFGTSVAVSMATGVKIVGDVSEIQCAERC